MIFVMFHEFCHEFCVLCFIYRHLGAMLPQLWAFFCCHFGAQTTQNAMFIGMRKVSLMHEQPEAIAHAQAIQAIMMAPRPPTRVKVCITDWNS